MNTTINRIIRDKAPVMSVGALSANLMNLAADIALLEQCGVNLLHFDVMDGHFVPQLTAGPSFVNAVKTKMIKDIHLMIENPQQTIAHYAAAGADIITVHAESCVHARYALQLIAAQKNANDPARGIGRGIAINPGTPLSVLDPLLDEADIVTLVAVNPGFPGQKLYPDTGRRAEQVRLSIAQTGRDILLCIDGGVTKENMKDVARMKPDIVVSGSAVFEGNAVAENLNAMTTLLMGNKHG
jgi:ribulose-phosphate 3-epimerase